MCTVYIFWDEIKNHLAFCVQTKGNQRHFILCNTYERAADVTQALEEANKIDAVRASKIAHTINKWYTGRLSVAKRDVYVQIDGNMFYLVKTIPGQ